MFPAIEGQPKFNLHERISGFCFGTDDRSACASDYVGFRRSDECRPKTTFANVIFPKTSAMMQVWDVMVPKIVEKFVVGQGFASFHASAFPSMSLI